MNGGTDFSTEDWGNWIATGEKMNLDLNLTPYAKINP